MRAVRVLLAVIIAAGALLAVYWIGVRRWRMNVELRAITNATQEAIAENQPASAVILARNNLRRLERSRTISPDNVEMLMLVAANDRVMRNLDGAVAEYDHALRVEPRPEIYINLGDTLLQLGRRSEAIAAYRRALAFDPSAIDSVDASVRDEVAH